MLSSPSVVFTADPLPSLPLQASISLTASHGTTTSSQEHPAPAASSCSLSALWSQRRTQSSGLLMEDEGLETGGSYKPSPAQSAVKLLDKLLDGGKASSFSDRGKGDGEGVYTTLCSSFNQWLVQLFVVSKVSPRCRQGEGCRSCCGVHPFTIEGGKFWLWGGATGQSILQPTNWAGTSLVVGTETFCA